MDRWLELLILGLGTLLFPMIGWLGSIYTKSVEDLKESLRASLEDYVDSKLDRSNAIDENIQIKIRNLDVRVKFGTKIAAIKFNNLVDKVEDIERYLHSNDSKDNTKKNYSSLRDTTNMRIDPNSDKYDYIEDYIDDYLDDVELEEFKEDYLQE